MRTVREALVAFAVEYGTDPERYLGVYLNSCVPLGVPERYRQLVADVVWRLPEGWDAQATWSVTVSDKPAPRGYASTSREEEAEGDHAEAERLYCVTLYPALLDRLPDAACRWAIAHEFAHIASGLPTGSIVIKRRPYTRVKGTVDTYVEAPDTPTHEDAADRIALEWGFTEELAAFLRED